MSYTKSLLLALLAISLVSFPIWQYIKVAERVEGFVADVGTVVGHVKKESNSISSRSSHTVSSFSSIISYQGANGDAKTFTSIVARFPAASVGTKVSILVEPIERNIAYEAGPLGIWLGVTITATMSFTLALFMALAFYFIKRFPSQTKR